MVVVYVCLYKEASENNCYVNCRQARASCTVPIFQVGDIGRRGSNHIIIQVSSSKDSYVSYVTGNVQARGVALI